ncbi:MAG: DUF3786 domain-containing protein [Proteobacteria bacterium]|nr:DUF3786 domain-containing protein [Pseudomonadota bacterium]
MALSVVNLYRDILPRTNCKDCGFPTCLAFASMVVSEKHPLKNCPHIPADVLASCEKELEEQYAQGKWLKRDLAEDALAWARSRASSMDIKDLPERVGGEIIESDLGMGLKLPYFKNYVLIFGDKMTLADGADLTRWEQVFILNHLAQGGKSKPRGVWKGFVQFPNTVSKIISMTTSVEEPLIEHFAGKKEELRDKALALGGTLLPKEEGTADISVLFTPLPRVPVVLLFWDSVPGEEFEPQVKLMFDETITEHLDIESIMFLSERIRQLLCGDSPKI